MLHQHVVKGHYEQSTLVFLHGFMGDHRDWLNLMAIQNSQYRRLVAVDIPGHGMSSVEPYLSCETFDDFARRLWQEIKPNLIGKVGIVGYSQGARFALRVKTLFPKEIEGLLLESCSFGILDQKARRARYEKDRGLLGPVITGHECFEVFLTRWYQAALFHGLGKAQAFTSILARRASQNPIQLQACLDRSSVGLMEPTENESLGWSGENWLVLGLDDAKYSRAYDHLRGAWNLNKVPGASHCVHVQQAEKFGKVLDRWLLQARL